MEIEDTGPGIAPDGEIGGLFQPFVQSRVGIEAQGGTGLGLALSREFARLMGGDITVESTVGAVDNVFRVDVPLELDADPSPSVGHRAAGARRLPISGKILDRASSSSSTRPGPISARASRPSSATPCGRPRASPTTRG